MKRISTITLCAIWMCAMLPASAQTAPGNDPVGAALIAPEVISTHQKAHGLSDTQQRAIQSDAESAQQRFTSLQWQLSAATEKLVALLTMTHVDQDRALAALDGVLTLERQLKHAQLTLMIQIKNELTPDQQARARQFAKSTPK